MIERSPVQGVLDRLPRAAPAEHVAMLERAYAKAAYRHRGQRRRSGDPYITHPVAVATIAAELGQDHEVLCAAILHDLPRDTACPEAELLREFGEGVVGLLRELSVLERSAAPSDCTDERVLVLRLADRLDIQRTIRFLPKHRQRVRSQETLDVFAPLAGRLGMDRMRHELEALARTRLAAHERSFRALAVAALLLPRRQRARWLEEWLSDLQTLPDRRARARFASELLVGMPRMAAALRWPSPGWPDRLLRVLRWFLRSDVRVWAVLAPLVVWMTVDTAAGSLADAVALVITVPPVLAAGVVALRGWLQSRDR